MQIHAALNRAAEWRRRSMFTESTRERRLYRAWALDAIKSARLMRGGGRLS